MKRRELVVYFAILVIVLGSILYATIPFVFVGRAAFYLYSAAQGSLLLLYTHLEGITTVYLWPDSPALGRDMSTIAGMSFSIFLPWFARVFFDTRTRLPRLDKVLKTIVLLELIGTIAIVSHFAIPLVPKSWLVGVTYAMPILVWGILPVLAIYGTIKWSIYYWPLAIAWIFMGLFIVSAQLVWFGVFAELPFGTNIYGITVAVEAICLSVAMMLRVREMQQDTLKSERRLSETLATQLQESRRLAAISEERAVALQDSAEKGRLLMATGHDARQMLSSIRNFATGLRLTSDGAPKVMTAGQQIDTVAEHLDQLLGSAIEGSYTGGIDDQIVAVDYLDVASIFETLRLIHDANARKAHLELRVRQTQFKLATDRVLVTRIMGNFLSNAIKYTSSGGVLLAARRRRGATSLEVWDTGIGLDPAEVDTLMSRRNDLHRFTDIAPGTGAGLHIAWRLADRIGASIEVRTQSGKGSLFRLVVPDTPPLAVQGTDVVLLTTFPQRFADLGLAVETSESSVLPANCRLLLVDEDFPLAGEHPQVPVVGVLYDRTAETRKRLSASCDFLIYKPVYRQSIERILMLSSIASMPSTERDGTLEQSGQLQ